MSRDEFVRQLEQINLHGVARRFSGSETDAQDAVQSALLKVWIHREEIRELGPFLNVTVQRTALSIRRQRARAFVPLDLVANLAAPTHDHARELSEQVEQALDTLSAPLREAVDAVILGEQDYQSAAASLNVPVGTIRSRINRARAELRGRLEE
jgi:RNA polymerase sigma-70 factor (ECF subfamily)